MNTTHMEQPVEEQTPLTDNIADELTNEQNETPAPEVSDISAEEELTQLKDAHLRLLAEYDNYRKRTIKEKADLIKNGGEKVLIGLLPVVDDFQRALDTLEQANDLAAVKEGVQLIYQKFMAFLQQNGVKAINTVGQPFDAELSEAVAIVPTADEEQKDKIIDTVQTGYTLNDKVIRHAKVVVAQ